MSVNLYLQPLKLVIYHEHPVYLSVLGEYHRFAILLPTQNNTYTNLIKFLEGYKFDGELFRVNATDYLGIRFVSKCF